MPDISSLNHLIEVRVKESPDLEILCIPDKNFNYVRYTTSELDAAASLLANHLKDTDTLPGRKKGDAASRLTVGLLGASNIEYIIMEMCLYRMGYCVLLVSPNNSPAAIAHLLTVTNASHLVVQDAHISSATEALTHLADPLSVSVIPQPQSDVFGPSARVAHPDKTQWDPPLTPDMESLLPVYITHSSGSTGFPKPVITTNKVVAERCKTNTGHSNMISLTTLPLYHTYGHLNMLRAWFAAKLLYLFPTSSIPLTSPNIITLLSQATDVQVLYGVPLVLRSLSETPEGLEKLGHLRAVASAGSACPDELGDFLVSRGVRLLTLYGLSETGQLMSSARDFDTDKEWNWVRTTGPYALSGVREYLRFDPIGSDTYELCVLDGWYSKTVSNQPDGSFATRDLFIKHPTIPDAYKHVGRIDDTLVMINGQKTNPVPIELALRSSPYITDAIVFGSGRTQIGALILLSEVAQSFSPKELIQRVAPAVTLANAGAPSHSQLSTETLVFLPYGTTIPRTDKASIIRARVYKEFEKVIEEMYARLEGEVGSAGKRHVEGEAEAKVAVRELIGKTLERPIKGLEDDTDLFEFGLNSLQSTRVRNAIQREVDLGGQKLSVNAVFEHPSITKLAKLIISLSSGEDGDVSQTSSQEVMLKLVDKYSHFIYSPVARDDEANGHTTPTSGKIVILTGATGSLGSYVFHELLADPDVETIYCLCRAKSDADATERLRTSLKTRKLLSWFSDAHETKSDRVVSLAADLPADRLGLSEERFREIASRVTIIIHCAWAVNFNLGISSFETHIRGAVNLMLLALSSPHGKPARFFFASSISAVLNWPGPGLIPEAVTDNPVFAEMGYGQSKWVTEKLCQIAARKTPVNTTILRIGQLVGDTTNGIWNESEGIPLIIKCADTIGILPELEEQVSWLPVDCAAKSIVELVNLPTPLASCPVYHVLHPTHTSWPSVLTALQTARLVFKRVPRRDWLEALRASDDDERLNPSRKLLTFYEGAYGGEETGRAELSVERTLEASRRLRETPAVSEGLVAKWVEAWRASGFLARARAGIERQASDSPLPC